MLIAVDIGNSSINIGYFTAKGLIVQKIETHPVKTALEYGLILGDFLYQNHIEKKHFSCIISSVVLSHTAVFTKALKELSDKEEPEVLIVTHSMRLGLKLRVNSPEELGTDRIANAVGAYGHYRAPVAVIDFGTATTITAIDQNGDYIGGSIIPGLALMNDTLDKGTSKLRKVVLGPPLSAVGKDTSGCILSGLFYGTAGAVERILSEMERETDCKFKTVITGGYGHMIGKFLIRPHDIDPNLTLEGLRILYEKNRYS